MVDNNRGGTRPGHRNYPTPALGGLLDRGAPLVPHLWTNDNGRWPRR